MERETCLGKRKIPVDVGCQWVQPRAVRLEINFIPSYVEMAVELDVLLPNGA